MSHTLFTSLVDKIDDDALTDLDEWTDTYAGDIGTLAVAPLYYRRARRVGAFAPRLKAHAAFAVGALVVVELAQRSAAKHAAPVSAEQRPGWHTDTMLPLMVDETNTSAAGVAVVGRTPRGQVVVVNPAMLRSSADRQIRLYNKAAGAATVGRLEVAVPLALLAVTTSVAVRRVTTGSSMAATGPLSRSVAARYVAAGTVRTLAHAALLRHLKARVHVAR